MRVVVEQTVTLGNVYTIISILGGIIAILAVMLRGQRSWTEMQAAVAGIKEDVETMGASFGHALERLQEQVNHISAMQQQLMDGRARMDRLDARLDRMEAHVLRGPEAR